MTNEQALAHLERLTAIHLSTVLAEGITEPAAILARMVELDNDLVSNAIGDVVAYQRHEAHEIRTPISWGSRAGRGKAIVKLLTARTWCEVNGKDSAKLERL